MSVLLCSYINDDGSKTSTSPSLDTHLRVFAACSADNSWPWNDWHWIISILSLHGTVFFQLESRWGFLYKCHLCHITDNLSLTLGIQQPYQLTLHQCPTVHIPNFMNDKIYEWQNTGHSFLYIYTSSFMWSAMYYCISTHCINFHIVEKLSCTCIQFLYLCLPGN